MRHYLLVTLLCLFSTVGLQSQTIKLFHEKKERGYILYATNNELYPISISLDLDLNNLLFSESDKKVFVVPAKNEKYKIGELTVAENAKKYTFSYKYLFTMGDITITNYEKSFLYDLPFLKGKSYHLFQGYNGDFSHQNENALDFTMPEGSEVVAAREGIVVKIVKNNT